MERFYEVGFTEFIFYRPSETQIPVFVHFTDDILPKLRLLAQRRLVLLNRYGVPTRRSE